MTSKAAGVSRFVGRRRIAVAWGSAGPGGIQADGTRGTRGSAGRCEPRSAGGVMTPYVQG